MIKLMIYGKHRSISSIAPGYVPLRVFVLLIQQLLSHLVVGLPKALHNVMSMERKQIIIDMIRNLKLVSNIHTGR